MASHISRFRRIDVDGADNAFVVVSVQPNGASALDLKILGTDNETEFSKSVRDKHINRLQADKYDGSDDEWRRVLMKTLLKKVDDPGHTRELDGIECVASVLSEKEMTLVWRRQTGEIIQRLGSLTLTPVEGVIDLFQWTASSAEAVDQAQAEVCRLNDAMNEQHARVTELEEQLDELVKAKAEHETSMLTKFCELLNEKKSKIRDQQRLLAKSNTQNATVDNGQKANEPGKSSPPRSGAQRTRASTKSKRKASSPAMADTDSDDFEPVVKQDIDEEDETDKQIFAEQETPDPSEEDDSNGSQSEAFIKAHGLPTRQKATVTPRKTPEKDDALQPAQKAPPPRRTLPFAKGRVEEKTVSSASQSTQIKDEPMTQVGEDTDSDDEL